jgi:hypothetical protein
VKQVIEKGDYIGKAEINKPRKDGTVRFHYFEGNVTLDGKKRFVGVSVGEDSRGNKFYNLNEDPDVLMAKKKARDSAEDTARGLVPSGVSASEVLDASIEDGGLNINLYLLELDRDSD